MRGSRGLNLWCQGESSFDVNTGSVLDKSSLIGTGVRLVEVSFMDHDFKFFKKKTGIFSLTKLKDTSV